MFQPNYDHKLLGRSQSVPRSATTLRTLNCTSPYRRRLSVERLEDRRLLTTITVDTLVDGTGVPGTSLREAIAAAGANDTINFSVNGTISLTSAGQLTINKNLTINGPGANLLTIQAYNPSPTVGNGSRVFNIDDGSTSSTKTVSISGLTLTGGDVSGDGGAIRCLENLTLTNSTISGSAATGNGGGIFSSGHNLVVTGSTVSGNTAKYGGGIYCVNGTLIMTGSTISGNAATVADGGGVYSEQCPVTMTSSTISGNSAAGDGGGIFSDATTVTLTSTTINGNTADTGGGISNGYGTLTVNNSTISGNQAKSDGGGIYEDHGDITVTHSTITGNRADSDSNGTGAGGGVFDISTGTEAYRHTILAGNTRGASTRSDASGPIQLQYSLIGDNTGATINNQGGNLIGTAAAPIDPLLGPLANNGGPTLTHALLVGSPAIDAGNASSVAGSGGVPQYDQRGASYGRVKDGDGAGGARIDIGAFEVQSFAPSLPGDYNGNHIVDAADYVLWCKTLGTTSLPAYSGADGNGNSAIDQGDYGVWRAQFGQTNAASGANIAAEETSAKGISELAVASAGALTADRKLQDANAFGTVEQTNAGAPVRTVSREAPQINAAATSRDDALLAWHSARDSGGLDTTHETDFVGDGPNCPTHEEAVDGAIDALDIGLQSLLV